MKNKILYIASADLQLKSGGGLANLAFYNSLISHFGERVDLIPFANYKPEGVSKEFYARPKSILKKALDFPKGIIHRFNPWIHDFLANHTNEYGCCIINSGIYGDIIIEIKKYIPHIIVIHHNCEVDFQNDNNRPTTLFGLFPFWVKRNEFNSYHFADLNLFLTSYDMNHFQEIYGVIDDSKKAVVGIYLPEKYEFKIDSDIASIKYAICGGLNNVQTVKGIKAFSKLLPILEEMVGNNIELIIAGRNPGTYIKNFCSSRTYIRLIENPVDMSLILLDSGIFICPINVGSGLKLRIMDGLKLGMPIITHEVSARGYEAFFNEPWFKVYKDETTFRKSLSDLLEYCSNNTGVRMKIIDKFKTIFSFENGDIRFINYIDKIVNGSVCVEEINADRW